MLKSISCGMAERQYSDFMRSLAAKYNNPSQHQQQQQQPNVSLSSAPPIPTAPTYHSSMHPSATAASLMSGFLSSGSPLMQQQQQQQQQPLTTDPNMMSANNTLSHFPFLSSIVAAAAAQGNQAFNPLHFPGLLDLSSTNALLGMMRTAATTTQGCQQQQQQQQDVKPLSRKRRRQPDSGIPAMEMTSLCKNKPCSEGAKEVNGWTVDKVCEFVASVEQCKDYAEAFRQQSIDGSTLLLLTEIHLVEKLEMKLGPVLKLRSALADKISSCPKCFHCQHCHQDSENRDEDKKNISECKKQKLSESQVPESKT